MRYVTDTCNVYGSPSRRRSHYFEFEVPERKRGQRSLRDLTSHTPLVKRAFRKEMFVKSGVYFT